MQFLRLPGSREQVATGLKMPRPQLRGVTAFPLYDDNAPMLSKAEIETIAKSGKKRGKARFGKAWIGNQRNKGSCNGFAGARALWRAIFRRGLTHIFNTPLSGAYLYSLINGGRDSGSMLEDGMNALMKYGCATEQTVPWDAIYPHLYDKEKATAEATANKAFECYAVRTEDALFSALALDFDCVVAVHADDGFMTLGRDGIAGGGYGPGNHAVACDGIGWSVANNCAIADSPGSWGTTYGDEGYAGLTWQQHFRHTTPYHVFYAIRSSVSVDPDPPPAAK